MYALIYFMDRTGSGVDVPSTPSGWALSASKTVTSSVLEYGCYVFTKTADSSDVAASNFTFTTDGTNSASAGAMLRLSNAAGGYPILTSSKGEDNTNDTSLSASISMDTIAPETVLVMTWFGENATGTTTVSGYAVSGSNPTWTERFDNSLNGTKSYFSAVATATLTSQRTITSLSATLSSAFSKTSYILFIIAPTTNATGTNALHAVSPTFFSEASVTVGGNGTSDLLNVSPNIFSQSGSGSQPTVWTTTTKS